jgi:hypothetical protein
MSRKKKEEIIKTPEQLQEENLQRDLSFMQRDFIPEPTYFFEIGDRVNYGAFIESIIVDFKDEDKKIYKVKLKSSKRKTNYSNDEMDNIEVRYEIRYIEWFRLRPLNETVVSLIQNEDVRLNYSQTVLGSLFSRAYHFGIDFDVEYQRDYVWDIKDKENLIDSIFNNIDIGKFVFARRDYSEKYLYEPIDGKQRTTTILDFYENKFQYKGMYFNDLSAGDKSWFENYLVNIAEVEYISKEQILKYFIMLNTSGKVMDKNHLDKVRKMLEQEN